MKHLEGRGTGTFRKRPGYKSGGDTSAVLQKKKNMAAVEDVTVGLPSLQFEAALTQEEKYLYFFYNCSNSSPGTG